MTAPRRVLVLTQHYAPEPISKPVEVARGMAERGHHVTVLTGFPNYPGGRIYPGYRLRLLQREDHKGISVLRVFLVPSHSSSVIGRVVNFCSFMVSSVLGALLTGPCDVIYVRHPPSTIGISAWLVGLMKRAPFVYDVQDIWPESGVWSGMLRSPALAAAIRWVERFSCSRASRVLVVTEGARLNLIGKGVRPDNISVMSQIVDEAMFADAGSEAAREVRTRHGLDGRFVVLFAGNIGLVQGLDAALDAAKLLADMPHVAFLLVGDGVDRERLSRRVVELGLQNVLFAGRRPETEMPSYMAAADAALLSLKYAEVCELAIPLKTFAYMAAGRPVIAAIRGAAAELVARAGAGLVIPPDDPQALAEAVRYLERIAPEERQRLGESGRAYISKHHGRKEILDRYEATLLQASL